MRRWVQLSPIAAVVTLVAALCAGSHAGDAPKVPGLWTLADTIARAITLEEALAIARQNAPVAIQAQGQLRSEEANVRSAYAAFAPSVSLSAGSTRQYTAGANTRIENGTVITLPSRPWSYNASVGGSLELFDGGRRFFDLRQAKAGRDAARANRISQLYRVDLSVKQQYFNVLAARESEAAARAQLEQAQQQLRAAVLRLRAARATKSDSLRSEIQVQNARLALLQSRTDLATANAALARAIGVPEAVTATEQETGAEQELTAAEEELERWAAIGPAVAQAEANFRAAHAARSASWTDYLPSLSATYARSGSGSGNDLPFGADDLQYTGTLRFSLSFPLFNQWGREEQLTRAGVALDNAEALLRDTRLAAHENLIRYLGGFRTANERVRAQTISVAAADEDLRVQQQRYALGESTLLDVLTSQTQLNEARAALIRARYDQRIARAELEALTGRDL